MNINRKRLLVLLLMNLLVVVHIILWYKFGCQKVGTFSLNGVVSLFGMGLINSAAAFFIFVVFMTAFFGRLFCGWNIKLQMGFECNIDYPTDTMADSAAKGL
ncbi:MAG: hypothetical protein HZC52_08810 [Planctomycetes bacterium]|uniref:hypothetical protein n=1 Tax=Candidatus Wunengus sp. YC65 TaxID=3367701 RepID=UPI001D2BB7D8|nr:hypothetical protein [Planctomycetota bacterium]